jgi:hypothetical protein
MAVASAHVGQLSQHAAIDDLTRFAKRAMVAMVEADADERPRPVGRGLHRIEVGGAARGGLFHQHVFPRPGRDDHDVDARMVDRRLGIGGRRGTVARGECARTVCVDVARDAQRPLGKRRGPLGPDESAADDSNAEFTHHDHPRSSGTMRRSV